MNPTLAFLLSPVYGNALAPEHLRDLQNSGLSDETIAQQSLRSVPPSLIQPLLGFDVLRVRSALLLPFPDPCGGFMNHVRLKVFPTLTDQQGHTVKYLQPRRSGVRLFFPLATLPMALRGSAPLWLVEGEKKALAVAQLGLPAVGFCGIEGWHIAHSNTLIPDFHHFPLRGRTVELVPDGDWQTNGHVRRAAIRLGECLETHGARARLVVLPAEATR